MSGDIFFFSSYVMVELVGEGSVINRATPSSWSHQHKRRKLRLYIVFGVVNLSAYDREKLLTSPLQVSSDSRDTNIGNNFKTFSQVATPSSQTLMSSSPSPVQALAT